MFRLDLTPETVNVRLVFCKDGIHVVSRHGPIWLRTRTFGDREAAVEFLESQIKEQERFAEWSTEVKIAGGWVCDDCGELDRELLEAHHEKPKAEYPELMYEPSNGKCKCLYCHALTHRDNPAVYRMIMARMALILYQRLYPGKFKWPGRRKNAGGQRRRTEKETKSLPLLYVS